jgi:hypothetical protein
MDQIYRSRPLRDYGWLSIHGGLTTMGRRERSRARGGGGIVIAWREREGHRGFSAMTPLKGGATEMAT